MATSVTGNSLALCAAHTSGVKHMHMFHNLLHITLSMGSPVALRHLLKVLDVQLQSSDSLSTIITSGLIHCLVVTLYMTEILCR